MDKDNNKSPPEKSKVLIISPDQITKLGLMQHIKSVMKSQTQPSTSSNNGDDITSPSVGTIIAPIKSQSDTKSILDNNYKDETATSENSSTPKCLKNECSNNAIAYRSPKLKKRDIQVLKQKITDKIKAQDNIDKFTGSTGKKNKIYMSREVLQTEDKNKHNNRNVPSQIEKKESKDNTVTISLIKKKLKLKNNLAKHLLEKEKHKSKKKKGRSDKISVEIDVPPEINTLEKCDKKEDMLKVNEDIGTAEIDLIASEDEPFDESTKEDSVRLKENCTKINVLSNETISLPQTCIDEMLKQNHLDSKGAVPLLNDCSQSTPAADIHKDSDNNQLSEENSNLEQSLNTNQIENVDIKNSNNDTVITESRPLKNLPINKDNEIPLMDTIEDGLHKEDNQTDFVTTEQSETLLSVNENNKQSNPLLSNIETIDIAQPNILCDLPSVSTELVKTSKNDQIKNNEIASETSAAKNVEDADSVKNTISNIKRRIKPKPNLFNKIKHSANSSIGNDCRESINTDETKKEDNFCKGDNENRSENIVDDLQLKVHKHRLKPVPKSIRKRKLSNTDDFKTSDSNETNSSATESGANTSSTNKDTDSDVVDTKNTDSIVNMKVSINSNNKASPINNANSLAKSVGISKRSGRKRKVIDYATLVDGEEFEETQNQDVDSNSNEKVEQQLTVAKGKRGRRKKEKIDQDVQVTSTDTSLSTSQKVSEGKVDEKLEESSADNSQISSTSEIIKQDKAKVPISKDKKKRGRPRGRNAPKNPQQNVFLNTVFQHTNIGNTSQATSDKLEMDTSANKTPVDNSLNVRDDTESKFVKSENSIVCAVCNMQLPKTAWSNHKYRNHNNLAWKVGDLPLDLNNQTLVMSILSDLYKRKKPLYCENCGLVKKSVLGYLSHKSVCQKSAMEIDAMRIKCKNCDHSILPVSMPAHLKTCKGLIVFPPIDLCENFTNDEEELPSSSKRKAASKAEKLFKETNEISQSARKKCTWYINFDFHPTYFGKKRIESEVSHKGIATCWFDKCSYETVDTEEMTTHIWKCTHKCTQGYTCKFCMITYSSENEILQHSLQNHSKLVNDKPYFYEDVEIGTNDLDLISDDLEEKCTKKNLNNNKKNLSKGISFLLKHRYYPSSTPVRYPPASDWSFQFCMQNYCMDNLFPNCRVTIDYYERLDPIMFCKYLPQQKYSVCTASIESKVYTDPLKLDYNWKRYKLFESDLLHNDTSTIFCGGSISAMAWVPTPYNVDGCEQILAISTNSNFGKGHPVDILYKESGVIQFWNCGTLKNNEVIIEKPKLEFCIVHDHGPIWCLEWCPSGCYDIDVQWNSLQRLGLLAVAAADSHVYIYSICFPESLGGKMFRAKPILELVLDTITEISVNGIEPHPTTISWSKTKEHQYIAVGYANGMIAVYNLQNPSSLLNINVNNGSTPAMLPYQIFNAHYHAITALHLYHLNDGHRWVMSGSLDRTIKYWDLENPTVPISNFTKFIVTDGVWLNHWISSVHTYDDCCGGGLTYTSIHQLRNFESECTSAMHSNSHVSSISGSEWTNGFVQGNVVGEIVGFFPHQLFYSLDGDKSLRKKRAILGYARLIEKDLSIEERLQREKLKTKKSNQNKSSSNTSFNINMKAEQLFQGDDVEPGTYEEVDEKYGIVFCDMNLSSLQELPTNLSNYYKSNNADKLFPSKPNIYPLQLINKIVINPNQSSYLYYATGYQAGFVRISSLKFLNSKRS